MDVVVTIENEGGNVKMFKEPNGAYSTMVRVMSKHSQDVTLLDAQTATKTVTLDVKTFNTLVIEVYGTAASRQLNFLCKSASDVNRAIQGVRLSDYAMATSTTTNNEIWSFDVTGLDSFVLDLTAVTGGNVSVKGKAVV